eukprot:COSAG01_NODE_15391_length_1343_cov_9.538585_1_plen_99_part_00
MVLVLVLVLAATSSYSYLSTVSYGTLQYGTGTVPVLLSYGILQYRYYLDLVVYDCMHTVVPVHCMALPRAAAAAAAIISTVGVAKVNAPVVMIELVIE